MADNQADNKKKSPEQGETRAPSRQQGRSRGANRPRRPRYPKKAERTAAGQTAAKAASSAEGAADKGAKRPESAKQPESARRSEQRRRSRGEQKPAEQKGLSRRRQSPDFMTAEQKAFAEATDIMLKDRGENAPSEDKSKEKNKIEIVGVRFRPTGKTYYFSPGGEVFKEGDAVIVETAKHTEKAASARGGDAVIVETGGGQEYGTVTLANCTVSESDTVRPLKPVIRRADEADTARQEKNRKLEEGAVKVWNELVAKHKLEMNLTDIEYTFDNTKLVFYYTADGRVDFRELVKDLASVFHTRIELRQIGVRDEAKMLGGIGVCGMPFCCSRFLPDFCQVSIRMAKEQNLSLSSSKISGNCGRLMCCLRYEQEMYEREHETFPRPGMVVQTAQGAGIVTDGNFISGKIKVQLDSDAAGASKVFTRDEVKVTGYARKPEPDHVDKELKELED